MTSGDYKGRKVTETDFWKKFLIWRYSQKGVHVSPKSDTLIFFSKTALTVFMVFGLNLALNMTFNLSEIYFSEKFAIWRYLTDLTPLTAFFNGKPPSDILHGYFEYFSPKSWTEGPLPCKTTGVCRGDCWR